MADLKICRICLRTEAKCYNYESYQLKYYYEEVIALKVDDQDGLPHYFCFECATMLHKFHKFKEKCYRGQRVLREIIWRKPISYEIIYNVDRESSKLKSNLNIISVTDKVKSYVVKAKEPIKTEQVTEPVESVGFNFINEDSMTDHDNDSINDVHDTEMEIKNATTDNIQPSSPVTIFVDIKNEVIKLDNEIIKEEGRRKNKDDDLKHTQWPIARKQLLKEGNWKKTTLSEEEALKDFRAKAEDKKYLAAAFQCTDCFKAFSKEDMLKRHKLLRHDENNDKKVNVTIQQSLGPHECRFCRMRFKLECYLRRHMRHHYNKYHCLRCPLVCTQENTALLHEHTHSGIKRKCIHCDEEFSHMSTYYTHLRTHRSSHVCALCGESFVSAAGLHQHKKVKHVHYLIESPDDDEEVNTFCERCDITFETRKAYREHLFHSTMHSEIVEDDERNGKISLPRKILGKREQSKITKVLNKKKEDGDIFSGNVKKQKRMKRRRKKPTTCHQCGQHFETQAACLKHHLAAHPRTSFFPPNERHICEICGASLAPGSVAVHQNIHSRDKVHTCDTCGKEFHSSIGLKRHQVTHTGEKPFACSLCDKRFTQSNSMKLHYRTYHLKEPYPKRNRRKKKDDQQDTVEAESGSEEESDNSLSEPDISSVPDQERELHPVPNVMAVPPPDENMDYLTLN